MRTEPSGDHRGWSSSFASGQHAHLASGGVHEADPALRVTLEPLEDLAPERDQAAVGGDARVAGVRDAAEARLEHPAEEGLDGEVAGRLPEVRIHGPEDTRAGAGLGPNGDGRSASGRVGRRLYTRSVGTDRLVVHGAREHNLKNVTLDLPRDRLIVFTGLSGSGKSSLAFDTIYAEGQRRYVESLSSYARQFLGQMEKPDVDFIEGLSPAISIDQKSTSRNPRSTVGTITEIYDYLRVLVRAGRASRTAPSAAGRSGARRPTRSSTR